MIVNDRLILAVILITLLVVVLVGITGFLLVLNADRRNRYRAELAEMQLRHGREVTRAEREATRQALRDMGRELHDNVGQLLEVARIGLDVTLSEHQSDTRLVTARDALVSAAEEVRRLGHSLNTDLWTERSLLHAIEEEAARLQRVSRVATHVRREGTCHDPAPDTRIMLYRVFQETVANTLKHSGADSIEILLTGDGPLAITVRDNGRGFDPEHTPVNSGIRSIRQRCTQVGYIAHLRTTPGAGCTWTFKPHGRETPYRSAGG